MQTPFKVLCFFEPSFFAGSFGCNRPDGCVDSFLGHFIADSLSHFPDAEIKTIVPSQVSHLNKSTHLIDRLNPIDISCAELFEVFTTATSLSSIYLTIYNGSSTEQEKLSYFKLLRTKLSDWVPDLIVTYPIHNDIVKELYPSALCLQTEFSVFSRYPAPASIKLDPFHYANEFARKYRDRIFSTSISDSQRATVNRFVNELRNIFKPDAATAEMLRMYRKQFKHLVLLPIPAINIYKESNFDDQLTFLFNTMSHIPKDIGVIITFHDIVTSQINRQTIEYLKTLYPNLIYFPPSAKAISTAASLNFFSQVDAVLNCCSMTGIQAIVFGTRMVALDKRYSHGFADQIGLDGLSDLLDAPMPDHIPAIYWLLTHGSIFDYELKGNGEPYFYKIANFYKTNGMKFELFPEIDSVENVTKYILHTIRANIFVTKVTRYIPYPVLYIERKVRKLLGL